MSSNKSLTDRAEAVYRQLRSMRRRFRLSAWITLIVGGLLLLLVAFYFSFGYAKISELKDPDLIVSLVGQMADDQIPILRQNIESQVKQNATTWAQQASDQVLDAIPRVREEIEKLALQQSNEVIARINMVGEDKFREILKQNRDAVQNTIDELKRGETAPDDTMLILQHAIEKEMQIDAKNQAEALRVMVTDLNASMEKLQAGENLNREQRAERRALMLARRLQQRHIGDFKAEEIAGALPMVGQIAEDMEARRLKKEAKEVSANAVSDTEAAAKETKKETAEKPEAKQEQPAEDQPAAKPEEAAKPAPKPEEKTKAEEKPADKPAEKPEEKKQAPAEEKPAAKPEEAAKPADKPEEKKEAAAEEKPADKPEEKAAKPADKPEEKKEAATEEKPADKPEEASKPADNPAEKKEAA